MKKKQAIFIKSYGCAFNRFRSQKLTDYLMKHSFFVHNQTFGSDRLFFHNAEEKRLALEANYVIVYACPITKYLEKIASDFILNVGKNNGLVKIIVTGCSLSCSTAVLKNKKSSGPISFLEEDAVYNFFDSFKKKLTPKESIQKDANCLVRTILIKIGCNNYCSYCACPHANESKNIKFIDIKKEIKDIQKSGVTSIEFGGPCVGDWLDPDNSNFNFSNLVNFILTETNLKIVNLELYPTDFSAEVIALLANSRVSRDISIPIQSGSDRVLKLMRRRYSRLILKKIFDNLFISIPELQLTTDIIIGYPGETKKDLIETLNFLNNYKLFRIDVYKYSEMKSLIKSRKGNEYKYFLEAISIDKYSKLARIINLTSK